MQRSKQQLVNHLHVSKRTRVAVDGKVADTVDPLASPPPAVLHRALEAADVLAVGDELDHVLGPAPSRRQVVGYVAPEAPRVGPEPVRSRVAGGRRIDGDGQGAVGWVRPVSKRPVASAVDS